MFFGIFVSPLADRSCVEGCERLYLVVPHIKVELCVRGTHVIWRVSSTSWIIAAGVKQHDYLAHANGLDAIVHPGDADRRLLKQRYVMAQSRVRRNQVSLPATLDSVPRKRDQ